MDSSFQSPKDSLRAEYPNARPSSCGTLSVMRKGKDSTDRGGARRNSGVPAKTRPIPASAFTSETGRLTARKRAIDPQNLPPYIIEAFDLRLHGKSVAKIAPLVNRKPAAVSKWFSRFADAYEARRAERFSAGRQAFDFLAENVSGAFSDGLEPDAPLDLRVDTAKTVAGYLYGKPGTSDAKETPPSIAITYIDVYPEGRTPVDSEQKPVIIGNQLIIPPPRHD